MNVKLKFYALRFVASIQIFLGGVSCIAAVVIFFLGLNAPSLLGIPATLFALWLLVGGVILMAFGELSYVFLGIEENTRMTNELLQDYIQSKAITPVVSGTDTYESSKSMNSIFMSISSSWKKEHSIGFGILIFLVIVLFIINSICTNEKVNLTDKSPFIELDEVSETNKSTIQSHGDSTKTSEENNKGFLPAPITKQPVKPVTNVRSVEQEYIKLIDIYDFQAKYFESLLEGKVPGVKFKLRNNGNRSLKKVEVTVYFKDANGNTIYEENFLPVNTSSWFEPDNPLKPQYIWQMEKDKFYPAKNVPDEWQEGKATVTINAIEFEE